jgi:hypothetical protein
MPANNYAPIGMLSLQFNLTELASQPLWSDGAGTVNAPAGFDRFEDIHDFLHGNCSATGRDLAALLNTALAVGELPGAFTAFIDTNDHVAVSYSEGAFSLRAESGDNPYGFSQVDYASSIYNGAHTVRAPNPWRRGVFGYTGGDFGTLEITIGATTVSAFDDVGNHQGVIQRLRAATLSDTLAGATTTNLTAIANGEGGGDRFLLNDSGRVEFWRSGSGRGDLVWESDALRDFLGFTGHEAATVVGASLRLVATFPPLATLWINRPIEYVEPRVRGVKRQAEASDGRTESAHLLTRKGFDIRFAVTGIADNEDRTAEALDGFFGLFFRAEHFTVYQNVNEPRRAVSNRGAYDLETTPEDNYRVGRLRLTPDAGISEFGFDLEDPQIRLRYFFDLRGWNWIP